MEEVIRFMVEAIDKTQPLAIAARRVQEANSRVKESAGMSREFSAKAIGVEAELATMIQSVGDSAEDVIESTNTAMSEHGKVLSTVSEKGHIFKGITQEQAIALERAGASVQLIRRRTGGMIDANVGYARSTKTLSRSYEGFKMHLLSIMFFGMQLYSTFGGLIQRTLQMIGITDLLSMALFMLTLPIALLLVPHIIELVNWIINLDESTKLAMGGIILFVGVIGLLLMFIGLTGLGIQGLRVWLTGLTKGFEKIKAPKGIEEAIKLFEEGEAKVIKTTNAVNKLKDALKIKVPEIKIPELKIPEWIKGIPVIGRIIELLGGFARSIVKVGGKITGLVWILDILWTWLTDTRAILKQGEEAFGSLSTTIAYLWEGIQNLVKGLGVLVLFIPRLIGASFKAVLALLRGDTKEASKIMQDWMKWFIDGLKSLGKGVGQVIIGIASFFWGIMEATGKTIADFLLWIKDLVWGFLKWLFLGSVIQDTLNGILKAITNFIPNIVSKISDMITKITNKISGLVSNALQFGKDFISNLARGIENSASMILNAIKDVIPSKITIAGMEIDFAKIAGIAGFQYGAFPVPGPIGAPMLAEVHGGETITPPGMIPPGGGGTFYITMNNYISSDMDIDHVNRRMLDNIRRDVI